MQNIFNFDWSLLDDRDRKEVSKSLKFTFGKIFRFRRIFWIWMGCLFLHGQLQGRKFMLKKSWNKIGNVVINLIKQFMLLGNFSREKFLMQECKLSSVNFFMQHLFIFHQIPRGIFLPFFLVFILNNSKRLFFLFWVIGKNKSVFFYILHVPGITC